MIWVGVVVLSLEKVLVLLSRHCRHPYGYDALAAACLHSCAFNPCGCRFYDVWKGAVPLYTLLHACGAKTMDRRLLERKLNGMRMSEI